MSVLACQGRVGQKANRPYPWCAIYPLNSRQPTCCNYLKRMRALVPSKRNSSTSYCTSKLSITDDSKNSIRHTVPTCGAELRLKTTLSKTDARAFKELKGDESIDKDVSTVVKNRSNYNHIHCGCSQPFSKNCKTPQCPSIGDGINH